MVGVGVGVLREIKAILPIYNNLRDCSKRISSSTLCLPSLSHGRISHIFPFVLFHFLFLFFLLSFIF